VDSKGKDHDILHVLSHHLSGETEENIEKPQSG
jgi:hypothetical protein